MPRLSIHLLGPFQVTLDGEPVTGFATDKVRALLAYLAVTADRPHRRETLAGLLWPEYPERSARASLRNVLAILRKATGDRARSGDRDAPPPFLHVTRQTIQFSDDSDHWLDVAAFTALLRDGEPESEALEEALGLYRGRFLEGFSMPDSTAFEEWLLLKREQLGRQEVDALRALVSVYEGRGEYEQALPYAWRQVEREPWQEEGRQQLMRLLALSGRRSEALAEELGLKPLPATTDLYERIRDGDLSGLGFPPVRVRPVTPPGRCPPVFLKTQAEPVEVEAPLFIGRERELAALERFLDQVMDGRGQLAFVIGEAGQGKTSLLNAFARRALAARPELIVATGICDVYTGSGDPYLPFRDISAMLTGDIEARWASGIITREHALRLWRLVPVAVGAVVEHGSDLIDTLIPGEPLARRAAACADKGAPWLERLEALIERKAASGATRGPDQDRSFEAYTSVLQVLARQQPLLLILDDLHWADASSVSLLSHLSVRLVDSPVFIVGAYRPEDLAPLRNGRPHPLQGALGEFKRHFGDAWVDLDQTDQRQGREFVDALLDSEPNRLGEDFRQQLAETTWGHPLFTVELLGDLTERGDVWQDEQGYWVARPGLVWDALPARVEGILEKRIGRLDPELGEVLAVASVEGEEFTAEVVAQVRGLAPQELVRRLSGELDKQHRLVAVQGSKRLSPDGQRLSLYRFRHNVFQRYIYNRLDDVERGYLHQAVGTGLERLYGAHTPAVAVQLARHFQVAGFAQKALDYMQQAGERAMQLSANEEAIAHLSQALGLLDTLPAGAERTRRELRLHTALGTALVATHGFAAPQVSKTYARARELCQQVGETRQLFPTLWGLWLVYFTRAEHPTALELGEQLLDLAQRVEEPNLLLQAHHALWSTLPYLGDFASARVQSDHGIALYASEQHHSLTFRYGGHNPGVCCRNFGGPVLWFLGYPDQALQRNREALDLAEELAHPFTLALAQYWLAFVHQLRREAAVAMDRTEAAIKLAAEHRFTLLSGWATSLRGWALAQQGQVDEGITQIRRGLADYRATGAAMDQTHMLALLAEAYGLAGQTETGLEVLSGALAEADRTGERHYQAEMHRLEGELLLAQDETGAETSFRRAIDVARDQGAKSWELRAVTSLSRLYHRQGKTEEAREVLAEIVNWFSEGFDTPDLEKARALLEALA